MKPVKLNVTGQQLRFSMKPQTEPEAQAAVREFKVDATAGYQSQNPSMGVGQAQGTIPAIVQYNGTVGDMANARRSACCACARWDQKAWAKFVAQATGPLASAEDKKTIEGIKVDLLRRGIAYQDVGGKPMSLEEIISMHGVCHVLSDWVEGIVGKNPIHWPVVTGPDANCPTVARAGAMTLDVVTPISPHGFFKPKDLDAVKTGDKRYDEVLRLAQGKKP
jgi:hypothetical protein